MRFKVPRHIEYKAKIVGPATFPQLVYLGTTALIVFSLYLFLGSSVAFYLFSILILSGGVALAFLEVSGEPLPDYIRKMLTFTVSSKKYIWKKESLSPKVKVPERRSVHSKEKGEKEEKMKKKKEGKISKITDRLAS